MDYIIEGYHVHDNDNPGQVLPGYSLYQRTIDSGNSLRSTFHLSYHCVNKLLAYLLKKSKHLKVGPF